MEAWQLLQGNIPSVIGGGETGNSSAAMAEEIKNTADTIVIITAKHTDFCIGGGGNLSGKNFNCLNGEKQIFFGSLV